MVLVVDPLGTGTDIRNENVGIHRPSKAHWLGLIEFNEPQCVGILHVARHACLHNIEVPRCARYLPQPLVQDK
jgi:hypothetical protein